MTREHFSGLILTTGLLVALGLHFFGETESPEPKSDANLIRTQLVRYYLGLKASDMADEERMTTALEKQWKAAGEDTGLCEVVSLLYWLEGEESRARKLLQNLPDENALMPLRYSINLANSLPDGWEKQLSEDWVGARIAAMAYKKMGNDGELANALIRVRHYENLHARNRGIESWLWFLNLIGMGLLISMWFSARQWARLGEKFFKLKPVNIPLATTLRFVGLFFLGFILIGMGFDLILPEDNLFLRHMLTYPLQIAWGMTLIYYQVFAGTAKTMTGALGLRNLKMRFINLFQIVGGLAMLVFLIDIGRLLAMAFRWPPDNSDFNAYITEIFQNPFMATCYLAMACVIAPVFEEVIFRGLIFRGLKAHMKSGAAVCLSAFFFCIIHPLPHWPHIFMVGVGLALIYNRTTNIMINIWAHAAFNLISILLALVNYF